MRRTRTFALRVNNDMKLTYLTDLSAKSLTPFVGEKMLAATFYAVLIVGAVIVAFWPWQTAAEFIVKQAMPRLCFMTLSAVLLVHSYLSLSCGSGEMIRLDPQYWEQKELPTYEKSAPFWGYTFIEFGLHDLFLLLPFLPFCVLTAAYSGVGWRSLAICGGVLLTASLLCRMFGFALYLLFSKRLNVLKYLLSRLLWAFFVLVSALTLPPLNPLRLLDQVTSGLEQPGWFGLSANVSYFAAVVTAIMLVGLFCQIYVKHWLLRHPPQREELR